MVSGAAFAGRMAASNTDRRSCRPAVALTIASGFSVVDRLRHQAIDPRAQLHRIDVVLHIVLTRDVPTEDST